MVICRLYWDGLTFKGRDLPRFFTTFSHHWQCWWKETHLTESAWSKCQSDKIQCSSELSKLLLKYHILFQTTKDRTHYAHTYCSCAKTYNLYNHRNHIFSQLIFKCESCVETWIFPKFSDWLLFLPGAQPISRLTPQITLSLGFAELYYKVSTYIAKLNTK